MLNNAPTSHYAISGTVVSIDTAAHTIILLPNDWQRPDTAPIVATMPRWLLYPGIAFQSSIPHHCQLAESFVGVEWSVFTTHGMDILSKSELLYIVSASLSVPQFLAPVPDNGDLNPAVVFACVEQLARLIAAVLREYNASAEIVAIHFIRTPQLPPFSLLPSPVSSRNENVAGTVTTEASDTPNAVSDSEITECLDAIDDWLIAVFIALYDAQPRNLEWHTQTTHGIVQRWAQAHPKPDLAHSDTDADVAPTKALPEPRPLSECVVRLLCCEADVVVAARMLMDAMPDRADHVQAMLVEYAATTPSPLDNALPRTA